MRERRVKEEEKGWERECTRRNKGEKDKTNGGGELRIMNKWETGEKEKIMRKRTKEDGAINNVIM